MKFVSVRDLRLKPGQVWKWLGESGQLVLTSNGKPFALVIGTDETTLDSDLISLARVRARGALSQVRQRAHEAGLDRLKSRQIDEFVRKSRRQHGRASARKIPFQG